MFKLVLLRPETVVCASGRLKGTPTGPASCPLWIAKKYNRNLKFTQFIINSKKLITKIPLTWC